MIECANYALLRKFANELAVEDRISYLEIGANEGHSAASVMSTGAIDFAVLIDTWGREYGGTGRGNPNHVVELLKEQMRRTLIITGKSSDVLPTLTKKFDLIFVDADHTDFGCWGDMLRSLPLLADTGIMVVDDLDHPQHSYLRKTVERFAKKFNMSMETYDAHHGVAELRKLPI